MSTVKEQSLEKVSQLIEQFNDYENILTPVFLQYNGKTEIITLQYRLRTFRSFMEENDFLKNLLDQFLKNPIEIPSNFFSVQINDQNSLQNLASDQKYFIRLDDFYLFHLSNLVKLDSEYITIIIDSKFKIDIESLVTSNISKQPKLLGKNTIQYELISVLRNNQFPKSFQCLNIPISFNLLLNSFLEYFIPKRFLLAADKWYTLETYQKGSLRKRREYFSMIKNKFGITPLEFNRKIQSILGEILTYIQENFNNIIKIKNLKGFIIPKIPKGYHRVERTGIIEISFKFETNFDNNQCVTHSFLTFDFNWMRKIFKTYFKL